jgi:hypothetical protein
VDTLSGGFAVLGFGENSIGLAGSDNARTGILGMHMVMVANSRRTWIYKKSGN